MKWCRRCVLPDTRPNLVIGPDGICNACATHARRREIDWTARAAAFADVAAAARRASRGYDCVIPVSGGKDSTWQVVTCLEHGLRPLAVTWKPPARTEIGRANLENLVALGVDHIDYQISPKVESTFMWKAFERLGSTAIPMHLALFNIPLKVAARFGIPLVVWGENSAFEYGSADEAHTGFRLDGAWLRSYGVTHGTTATDWVDADLPRAALTGYFGPDADALEAQGVRAVFLGYYFPWDPEISHAVATAHGFRGATEARTGYYAYADIDDDFIALHHWMKWYKFGFTRLFDNLSLEIRFGRIGRHSALDIIRRSGEQMPRRDIAAFCRFAGIEEKRFFVTAERFRNTAIWQRRTDGVWYIPGFLIEDWAWG
jgi:N-acetyl sugar amidotransferase